MASRDTNLNIIVNARDNTAKGFTRVEKGLASMHTTSLRLSDSLRTMGRYGTVAFAALSAASTKLVMDSAQSLQIQESYERMTKQAGIATDELLAQLKRTSAGTVSSTDLMLSANRAMALGVGDDMETVTTLMEIARLKGRALGLDTTQAFNDIVTGIGRGSPLILDNLGITIKLGEAQEMYAEKLGKTSAELTDAEKKQALLNAVMESGKEELAAAGEVQVTTAEKMQKLKAQFQDAADTLGRTLIPAATRLIEAVTPIIEKVAAWVEANPKLTATIVGLALAATALMVVLGAIGVALPIITAGLAALSGPGLIVIGIIAGIGFAVMKVVGILDIFMNHWDTTWLGIKLIAADAANGVIETVENMINFIIDSLNGFIGSLNRIIARASDLTGVDVGQIGNIGNISLGRVDTGAIIDRSLATGTQAPSVVISGNSFLSEDAAEQMGDLIMQKLKLSNSF